MTIPRIIAIDGPAASGKSTVGEKLAEDLGYFYFDTGIMYRAVTWAALQAFQAVSDEKLVSELAEKVNIDVRPPSAADGRRADVFLDGKDITWDIRTHQVDIHVSQVSTYPGVRNAMTMQQRRIAQRGNVVMVGRDIGTIVLPDADLKIYLDASVEQRARRRFNEQQGRGGNISYEEILASMKRRDKIDSTRVLAPLKPAEDAIIIQTDDINLEEVIQRVKSFFNPVRIEY